MEQERNRVKLELRVLREDHHALEEEVRRLRRSIVGLQATSGSPRGLSEGGDLSLSGVGSAVERRSPASPSYAGAHSSQASSADWSRVSAPAATGVTPISWARREEIADNIGLWIRRCLAGQPRGTSTRDQNPYQSRLWIVVKSIDEEIFNPPLVFRSWTAAKAHVKRGSETGDSIFVGVPSEKEALRAVRTAGLEWSGTYSQ